MTLPDVDFIDTDTSAIEKSIITGYEAVAGRTLAQGDPVRLFLLSVASIIVQQRVLINYAGKMNLLAYSKGDYLDHIGLLVGTKRLGANAAKTTIEIKLSEARAAVTVIPAGIRVTAGDNVFFAIEQDVIIPAGETTVLVPAICTESGEIGNNYLPGQIKTIVDPQPFVQSMVNISTSSGGSSSEDDESFRKRIQQAPESFSCAGPDGAYEYWAKSASSLIADVSVQSSEPCKVEIYLLLENGELPSDDVIAQVKAVLNDKRIRPLTDQLFILSPEKHVFNIDAEYYISSENQTTALSVKNEIEKAVRSYAVWQKSKLGRDINPSELIRLMVNAGAKRVNLINPSYCSLKKNQVGIAEQINITFGGVEDD